MGRYCRRLTILLLSCICAVLQAQETQLRITITHIKSDQGIVRIALYDHPDQFPYHPAREFDLSKEKLKDNKLSMIITDLKVGKYAISILDDENSNNEMDYNFFHIPKEGYGFTNDIKPGLRPPPYEKCTFSVKKGENRQVIRTQYFGK